jgi:hypothetical protein
MMIGSPSVISIVSVMLQVLSSNSHTTDPGDIAPASTNRSVIL